MNSDTVLLKEIIDRAKNIVFFWRSRRIDWRAVYLTLEAATGFIIRNINTLPSR